MSFFDIVLRMFPYWFLGLFMIYAVYHSKHRDLLRIDFKLLAKFCLFLIGISVLRYMAIKHIFSGDIGSPMQIPWQTALTVFWEDMVYALPLAILRRFTKGKKYGTIINYMLLSLSMVLFGLAHMYKGWQAVFILSFYVPFSVKIGEKRGFGTMMLGHSLYDLATILIIQHFAG